ncbi:hypothetical protein SCHPADRAFT_904820 [Schizopora paradoxa]|uniref:Uncharacterized protein n=1 Tax=Schizopora paradoxa TaxID=27342 RepID=A0A0H2RLD7_9AGAM|nr:hypothetical protein SCHPADRAFT_904820 [Schizopora paradoxa]
MPRCGKKRLSTWDWHLSVEWCKRPGRELMPEIPTTAELLRKRGLMTMRQRLFRAHADGTGIFTLTAPSLELSLSLSTRCERAHLCFAPFPLTITRAKGVGARHRRRPLRRARLLCRRRCFRECPSLQSQGGLPR